MIHVIYLKEDTQKVNITANYDVSTHSTFIYICDDSSNEIFDLK